MVVRPCTAQVLIIVKALAWVIIAVSRSSSRFPAAQEEQTGDGMDPGGTFA